MNKINFSGILLLALVIPFIMTYGLGPGKTPYWLFGLIFFLALGYLGLDLLDLKVNVIDKYKSIILWAVIFLVIGGACVSAIIVRHRTAPIFQVHDIVLQQEAVIQFLLQGKNPYNTSYFGTPLENWHYSETAVNPALYHFVMMPWYLLFSLPFYFISISVLGFFDGRMPLYFLFVFLLILAWKLLKSGGEKRHLFLLLLAFNPASLGYFLEGRSDIFAFAFLFWAFFLLKKERYLLAGIPLALAFATKQSVWPIFPFYLAYLWGKNQGDKRNWGDKVKKIISQVWPFALTFSVVVLPFAAWDFKTFWQSTIGYLSGTVEHSYPVSGYGVGMVLNQIGVIKDLNAYYPFWIWQLAVGIPLLAVLMRWLVKSPSVWRLITGYGIFTFVFWYFSRYFNNSHLGYLSMVFISAYGFYQAEKE